MLPLLFLTIFLAAGVTANKVAGKYQVLFFYQLYRVEVDAFGFQNTRMAPGCDKNGAVCDLEAFIKEVCKVKKQPERDANGKIIKDPVTNKPTLVNVPDFSKVDWTKIGEGGDLDVFNTEFEKSDFKGDVFNDKIFKGWNKDNNFENVMKESEDIGTKAIDQLKKDGKTDKDRLNKMTAALKVHADARRYDQAKKITDNFEDYMKKNGFTVAYTDPVERPPVPGYRKIDTDQTIKDNKGKQGFDKVEPKIKSFVTDQNTAAKSKSHVEGIAMTDDIHKHLANACKA